MNNQVILIKDYQLARAFADRLIEKSIPFATVEAEYGDFFIEGTHATLAHHVSCYRDYPAPCIRKDVRPLSGGVILVSHLDLDTLGGIALLEDCYFPHSFWESEAIIDTQGALGLQLIPQTDADLMKIYWSWDTHSTILRQSPITGLVDVTAHVRDCLVFLNSLLTDPSPFSTYASYLKAFEEELEIYAKSCVYEDEHLRLFVNDQPMHFQMHQRGEEWVDFCLHYNPKRQSLILSDISGQLDCGAFMKQCFGPKAGGQYRIAGTPRDETFSLFALYYLKQQVELFLNH